MLSNKACNSSESLAESGCAGAAATVGAGAGVPAAMLSNKACRSSESLPSSSVIEFSIMPIPG
jgi:hypothetical protein